MSYIILDEVYNRADVNGVIVEGKNMSRLYVTCIASIIRQQPSLEGVWKPRFTFDRERGGHYNSFDAVDVAGRTLFINTNLNSKAKIDGIKKLCEMAGWSFKKDFVDASQPATTKESGLINTNPLPSPVKKEKSTAKPILAERSETACGLVSWGEGSWTQSGKYTSSARAGGIEIQDKFFYIKGLSGDKHVSLCCCDLKNGQVKELDSFESLSNRLAGRAVSATNAKCLLSCAFSYSYVNHRIIYTDGEFIYSISENGEKKQVLTQNPSSSTHDISFCIAFGNSVVYKAGFYYYRYDIDTGNEEKLTKLEGVITNYTSEEIVFNNEKIFNVFTKEVTGVTRRFPAVKKEQIILVDLERDIVYYLKKGATGEPDQFIGVDRQGNVVDVWKIPITASENVKVNTENFCFDGRRVCTAYCIKEREDIYHIRTFDRSGNTIAFYENIAPYIGAYLALTPHMITFLAQHKEQPGKYFDFVIDERYRRMLTLSQYC